MNQMKRNFERKDVLLSKYNQIFAREEIIDHYSMVNNQSLSNQNDSAVCIGKPTIEQIQFP